MRIRVILEGELIDNYYDEEESLDENLRDIVRNPKNCFLHLEGKNTWGSELDVERISTLTIQQLPEEEKPKKKRRYRR